MTARGQRVGSGAYQPHSALGGVEPPVHVAAGLERRNHLLGHRDLDTIAWVSSGARLARLDREHAKVAQLHTIATRQSRRNRAQDRVDDGLHIPLVQVWVLRGDFLDQFRLEHEGSWSCGLGLFLPTRSRTRYGAQSHCLRNDILICKPQCKLIAAIARKYARQRVKLIGMREFVVKLSAMLSLVPPASTGHWMWNGAGPTILGFGHSKTLIEPSL